MHNCTQQANHLVLTVSCTTADDSDGNIVSAFI